MSADTMIICKEDNSHYEGTGTKKAFCIGETSMGESHDRFSEWFRQRYCGGPGILEQLAGIKEHRYIELTQIDIDAIKRAFQIMEHKDYIEKDKFFKWLDEHVEKHISTENW